MTKYEELKHLFELANKEFLKNEKDMIERDISERTLCGSLMKYLHEEKNKTVYKKYYVDVEYNRNCHESKKIKHSQGNISTINCDLIFHSRGNIKEKDNLIALEMKKSNARSEAKEKDKERLKSLTSDSYNGIWKQNKESLPKYVCGYELGIFYEIDIRREKIFIEYYKNGQKVDSYILSLNEF